MFTAAPHQEVAQFAKAPKLGAPGDNEPVAVREPSATPATTVRHPRRLAQSPNAAAAMSTSAATAVQYQA